MTSVLDTIVRSITAAGSHPSAHAVAPVAVLWTDPERAWGETLPALRSRLPLLSLGELDPSIDQGPAVWLRTRLVEPSTDGPWVVYLPGVRRDDLGLVEQCPVELQPLVELQHRTEWWEQRRDTPWTPLTFLRAKSGAALDIATGPTTAEALQNAIGELLGRPVAELGARGRLDAGDFSELLVPDHVRTLLEWVDDPQTTRSALEGPRWTAFRGQATAVFGLDPDAATPITAATLLGARTGPWAQVWARYTESPARFPHIPDRLDAARPEDGGLFVLEHPDSWPTINTEAETAVRSTLLALAGSGPAAAATAVHQLEGEHAERRSWPWASLGRSPLAAATGHLAALASLAAAPPPATLATLVDRHVGEGWHCDDLAVRCLAAVSTPADREAVLTALDAVYSPWVDATARRFQEAAVSGGYPGGTGLEVGAGTCVVFVDGLRFDLGHRLRAELAARGELARLEHRLAAFPTVTPTGKPAVAPLTGLGAGPDFSAGAATGKAVDLPKALAVAGTTKFSAPATGDPDGQGWTDAADIDTLGHAVGLSLVSKVDAEIRDIADRIVELLTAGWKEVRVVTDHGFLLSPRPMLKVELKLHLTEGDACRKPRVARLRGGVGAVDHPTVPWTWDDTVRMVSAPGATSFQAGCHYEHGGLSPQECVIPVLTVTSGLTTQLAAEISDLKWIGMRCRVDVQPATDGLRVELRTAPGDAGTRVGKPAQVEPGKDPSVTVQDFDLEGTPVHVVLLDAAGTVLAQRATTVGGSSA